jgi:uncharacterized membrane protein YbhN (UPF0104 family)
MNKLIQKSQIKETTIYDLKTKSYRNIRSLFVVLFYSVMIYVFLRIFEWANTDENLMKPLRGFTTFSEFYSRSKLIIYYSVSGLLFLILIILLIVFLFKKKQVSVFVRMISVFYISLLLGNICDYLIVEHSTKFHILNALVIENGVSKISSLGVLLMAFCSVFFIIERRISLNVSIFVLFVIFVLAWVEILTGISTFQGAGVGMMSGAVIGRLFDFVAGRDAEYANVETILEKLKSYGINAKTIFRIPWDQAYSLKNVNENEYVKYFYNVKNIDKNKYKFQFYTIEDFAGNYYDLSVFNSERQLSHIFGNLIKLIKFKGIERRPTMNIENTVKNALLASNTAKSFSLSVDKYIRVDQLSSSIITIIKHENNYQAIKQIDEKDISTEMILETFKTIKQLNKYNISHSEITDVDILFSNDKKVLVTNWWNGNIMPSELEKKLDIVHILTLFVLLTNQNYIYNKKDTKKINEKAIGAFTKVFSAKEILAILPLIQVELLPKSTMRILTHQKIPTKKQNYKDRKYILNALRNILYKKIKKSDDESIKTVSLQRFSWKNFVLLGVFALLIYMFVTSLSLTQLKNAFAATNTQTLMFAVLFVFLSYLGGAISLKGYSITKLPLLETYINQISIGFFSVVAPGGIGFAMSQIRLLIKHKQEKALAVATATIVQLTMFLTTMVIFLFTSLFSPKGNGESNNSAMSFVKTLVIILFIVVLGYILYKIPVTNKFLRKFIRPQFKKIEPLFISIKDTPVKLVFGILGNLLQTVFYATALILVIHAFGYADVNVFNVTLAYLIASLSGSFVPTPGGMGAVEIVLGATLVGFLPAISSNNITLIVLVFRIISFWMMIPIGYIAYKVVTNKTLFSGTTSKIVRLNKK